MVDFSLPEEELPGLLSASSSCFKYGRYLIETDFIKQPSDLLSIRRVLNQAPAPLRLKRLYLPPIDSRRRSEFDFAVRFLETECRIREVELVWEVQGDLSRFGTIVSKDFTRLIETEMDTSAGDDGKVSQE